MLQVSLLIIPLMVMVTLLLWRRVMMMNLMCDLGQVKTCCVIYGLCNNKFRTFYVLNTYGL